MRELYVNDSQKNKGFKFATNYIKTTRYTFLSFLPMSIIYQYMKMANLFFLFICVLCLFPSIAPWEPMTQIAPTIFVLLVSMIREAYEDVQRLRNDRQINKQEFKRINPNTGKREPIRSQDIMVGDMLYIREEQELPSDLILIDSSSKGDGEYSQSSLMDLDDASRTPQPKSKKKNKNSSIVEPANDTSIFAKAKSMQSHCYLQTTSLDGEKNLKKRLSPKDLNVHYRSANFKNFRAQCQCDLPNLDLYNFKGILNTDLDNPISQGQNINFAGGAAEEQKQQKLPDLEKITSIDSKVPMASAEKQNDQNSSVYSLNENHILLKGAKLMNTKWVVGFVVYTGNDTKLMQNQQKVRFKQSKQEKEMNKTVVRLFFYHVLICFILAMASQNFNNQEGWKPYLNEAKPKEEEVLVDVAEYEGIEDVEEDVLEAGDELKTASQSSTVTFFTYLTLNSTFIPVSLMVTIEIVKAVQGMFIRCDAEMYSGTKDRGCTLNTVSLNEELGQVRYVFSDKTGTLTQNMMEFKICKIGDQIYGDQKLIQFSEEDLDDNDNINDSFCSQNKKQGTCYNYRNKFLEQILFEQDGYDSVRCDFMVPSKNGNYKFMLDAQKLIIQEFLKILALTHECIAEEITEEDDEDDDWVVLNKEDAKEAPGAPAIRAEKEMQFEDKDKEVDAPAREEEDMASYDYQGPSPDEIALVEMAKMHGYEYVYGNELQRVIRLKTRDPISKAWKFIENLTFKLHRVIPFTSERKRMSVIVQDPTDGHYKLYCKGADSTIKKRLNMKLISEEQLQTTDSFLKRASLQGLRTLLVAMRIIEPEELEDLQVRFKEAETDLYHRNERLEALYDEIETDLCLIGATVVEDRLQDEVEETIEALHQARIKVWMLTGDKFETAESIGYSSKLLVAGMDIIKCEKPTDIAFHFNDEQAKHNEDKILAGEKRALIIEADVLQVILKDDLYTYKRWFLKIARTLETVICCRVSPSQKAEVVRLIRDDDPEIVALAIGDGANDVSMILEADIGIGVYGNEGMQAVDNSDYAIPEFRHLWYLLFKHGRWNYLRMSKLIPYFLYKNYVITCSGILFACYNGFSGAIMFEDYYYMWWNLFITCYPITINAVTDQDIYPIPEMDGEQFKQLIPFLYYSGQRSLSYNQMTFYWWAFIGTIHIVISYMIPTTIFQNGILDNGLSNDFWTFGQTVFLPMLYVVNQKFFFICQKFNIVVVVAMFLWSYVWYTSYIWYSDMMYNLIGNHFCQAYLGVSATWYLTCFLILGICYNIDVLIQSIQIHIFTDPAALLQMHLYEHGYKDVPLTQTFLDEFHYLSSIQQQLGLFEDYWREEELERIRQFKQDQLKQELEQENKENNPEDPNQKKKQKEQDKQVAKKGGFSGIYTDAKQFLKNTDGPEQPGNIMTRFMNNIKNQPANFNQQLHRVRGVERKMPDSRGMLSLQKVDSQTSPTKRQRGKVGIQERSGALELKKLSSAPTGDLIGLSQPKQRRQLRINDIDFGDNIQPVISKNINNNVNQIQSNGIGLDGGDQSNNRPTIEKSKNQTGDRKSFDRQKFKDEMLQEIRKPHSFKKKDRLQQPKDLNGINICEEFDDDAIIKQKQQQQQQHHRFSNGNKSKPNQKPALEEIYEEDISFSLEERSSEQDQKDYIGPKINKQMAQKTINHTDEQIEVNDSIEEYYANSGEKAEPETPLSNPSE